MYQNFNNPSYYRAHHFKNQLELPSAALKNRSIPQFYSQIPKGKQFFQPTNKKHYQTLAHQSQIQQQFIMKEQMSEQDTINSRIAMDKSYFRSLNVDDIEGAKPNTLISKAVKNKQRAYQLKKQQQKHKAQNIKISNQGYFQQNQKGSYGISLLNQHQAQKKLRKFNNQRINDKNNLINYSPNNFHFSSKPIQSYNIMSQRNNQKVNKININQKGNEKKFNQKFNHMNYQEQKQFKLRQQQVRIKQLQQELALQKSRGKNKLIYSDTVKPLQQKRYISQFQQYKNLQKQKERNMIQYPNKFRNQSQQNKSNKSSNMNGKELFTGEVSNKMRVQSISNSYKNFDISNKQNSYQIPQNNLYGHKIGSNFNAQQKKSNVEDLYLQNNLTNNRSAQNLNSSENDNSHLQGNKSLIFDDKVQYRKYNPTFLSYEGSNGINSISLAGKNIVGQ